MIGVFVGLGGVGIGRGWVGWGSGIRGPFVKWSLPYLEDRAILRVRLQVRHEPDSEERIGVSRWLRFESEVDDRKIPFAIQYWNELRAIALGLESQVAFG